MQLEKVQQLDGWQIRVYQKMGLLVLQQENMQKEMVESTILVELTPYTLNRGVNP
jgi:hypothetical protein